MEGRHLFVERYRVVPAVDVDALRAALRPVVADPDVVLALGPSLLGTLDMDALPVGMHPFVDPDRRVRPLRDDLVVLGAGGRTYGGTGGGAAARAAALAGTASLVERLPLAPVEGPAGGDRGGVLVLLRTPGDDGSATATVVRAGDPAAADEALDRLLDRQLDRQHADDGALGADLYVVVPRDWPVGPDRTGAPDRPQRGA